MKEQNGFIYLHRKILNNPYLNDKPFCRGFAWCVLLALTNRKVGYIDVKNGQQIKLMRGDCGYSQKALADIFGWSRGQVKRFLNELENRKMIQQKIVANHTIIRVLKFNIYQNRQQTDILIEQQKNTKIEQQKIPVNSDCVYISKTELEKMIQQKIQETDRKTTTNNNNTIYSNNIISSSSMEKFLKEISKEEEEELKKISKENKIKYFRPWLRAIIDNGDIKENLEKARNRIERRKQKEILAAETKKEEPQISKEEADAAFNEFKKSFNKMRKERRF